MFSHSQWHHCILPPYLFRLYVENITQKAGLSQDEVRVKIGRRNIDCLRDVHDTIRVAENSNDLKPHLK